MEQGFSCSTPAFRNTDILEGICRKKSNVICNLFLLRCDKSCINEKNTKILKLLLISRDGSSPHIFFGGGIVSFCVIFAPISQCYCKMFLLLLHCVASFCIVLCQMVTLHIALHQYLLCFYVI